MFALYYLCRSLSQKALASLPFPYNLYSLVCSDHAINHTLNVMMRHILLSFLVAVALVAASPARPILHFKRGTAFKLNEVAKSIGTTAYHATSLHRRQDQPASDAVTADPLNSLSAAQKAAVEQAVKDLEKPFGNAAIWKEAIDFDKERGDAHENRNFYQILALLQEAENSSQTVISPYVAGGGIPSPQDQLNTAPTIGKALQFLQAYPAHFKQPQASDPAKTLGKFSGQGCSDISD